MPKVVFENCDQTSQYWDRLECLFQSEWSDFKFSGNHAIDASLPPVIAALSDNKVIGGLAYSRYQEPHKSAEVIWLNAVFVGSEWRGQGIASQLINLGVNQVCIKDQSSLYAYTNVAPLYQSLGWSIVDIESEPNHNVMSILLVN